MKQIKEMARRLSRELAILAFLVVSIVIFGIMEPSFFMAGTFVDIIEQSAINGFLAIGMTFIIITGGIDLSVGSTMAVAIIVCGKLAVSGVNPFAVLLIALGIGAVLGLVNGMVVTRMRLQPFVATMGTNSVFRGIAYVITGGWPVTSIPTDFRNILNSVFVGGIRTYAVVFVVMAIIYSIILKRTRVGTYIYAIGSNEDATKLSGVNTDRYKVIAYILGGVVCGLAGAVMISRLGTGEASAGEGYELNAIAAAAIGGTSLAGGKGSILGTAIGAIVLSTIRVGLVVIGVDTFVQYIVVGVIILLAAYVETIQANLSKHILRKSA